VVARIRKGATTVAVAFDSTEPDSPHFDVLRIDTTGRGDFNGAAVVPRSLIQDFPAKESYRYHFEDYGVSLSLMDRQILAWIDLYYLAGGTGPHLQYRGGTSAEGRCQFGDKVYWIRFVDANSTLRVTDEPRLVSAWGRDHIEGDYIYVYTHGENLVRASLGYYGQPIQVDGQWWNVRIAGDGQHVTAEPYQGPLTRLQLKHPFWRLMLLGKNSILNVSGGEESVAVPAGQYTVYQYHEYVSPQPDSESQNLEMSNHLRPSLGEAKLHLKAGTDTVFRIGTPLRVTLGVSQRDGSLFFDVELRDCQGRGAVLRRVHRSQRSEDYDPVRIVMTRTSDQLTLKFETQWAEIGKRGWKIPQGLTGTFTATVEFPSDTFQVECEPATFTIE